MKTVIVLIFLGVGFFLIAGYYASVESPFDIKKLQEYAKENNIAPNDFEKLDEKIETLVNDGVIVNYFSPNAYIEAVLILSGVACLFASLHMVLDKLFFKNFYEKASLPIAIRRGIFFVIALAGVFVLKLYLLEIYYIILFPVLILLIEIIITKFITEDFVKMVKRLDERIKKNEEENS